MQFSILGISKPFNIYTKNDTLQTCDVKVCGKKNKQLPLNNFCLPKFQLLSDLQCYAHQNINLLMHKFMLPH